MKNDFMVEKVNDDISGNRSVSIFLVFPSSSFF